MNIDNLDKKNIYKTPEHFFDEMQSNVLKETIGAKIIPLKTNDKKQKNNLWWYAAAVVLVAGLGIFFSFPVEKTSMEIAENKNEVKNLPNHSDAYAQTTSQTLNEQIKQKIEQENTEIIQKTSPDIRPNTILTNNEPSTSKPNANTNKPSTIKATEELVASLSGEDLSELYRNTENDVYLDLYY